MRQGTSVLFLAVDSLIPVKGRPVTGLEEFSARMDHAGVPIVWVSARTRLQLDEPRRRIGHRHPFIAEDGCGVYLPEDYFHLRPEKTIRLGRFMCIPIAEPQPAAAEALEALADAVGVEAVPLRSLSPRELAQNAGLPEREAELLRQRDFDELFFLAGASNNDLVRLRTEAQARKIQLRESGVLWSLAVGASVQRCVRELAKLYQRALRHYPGTVAAGTAEDARSLFTACDRRILLLDAPVRDGATLTEAGPRARPSREMSLRAPNLWQELLQELGSTRL